MIELTRLNGHALILNSDLVKHVEAIPDTTITLTTGDKLVVLESCAEVLQRARQYHAQVLRDAWPSHEAAINLVQWHG